MSKTPAKTATKPPAHLSDELKRIWKEVRPTLGDDTPPSVVETLCQQVQQIRSAQASIERDGQIVRDAKDNAAPHPALQIQRDAAKTIDQINKTWAL